MSGDQIKLNLNHQNSLMLYHFFTELTDALRPVLHNPNKTEIDIQFWFEKLFQLRSIINDCIEPGNTVVIQMDKTLLENIQDQLGHTFTKVLQ